MVRVWETEGIHPNVVACSHHVGRWRLFREIGGQKRCSSLIGIRREGSTFLFRQKEPAGATRNGDPDSERVWWKETGVNQNLTFPVQPDPVSGMHCWHQKVTVEPAHPGDRYADVFVDTAQVARGLRGVEGSDVPGAGAGRPAPAPVDEPAAEAGGRGVQARLGSVINGWRPGTERSPHRWDRTMRTIRFSRRASTVSASRIEST